MSASIKEQVSFALKLHQSGELAEAEKLYAEILKLCPDNVDTLNLFGLLKLQKEEFKDAVHYIKKAVELKPCAYFYESLGKAYIGCENFKDAIDCYKKALELTSDNFDALFNLAFSYRKNNQLDKAIETYNLALSVKENHPDIYFNLANIYENKNDTPTALEYFKKAHEHGITYDNIKYFLGVSYLKLKEFKQGWEYYEHRPSYPFSIRTQEHQLEDLITSKPIWAGEDIRDKALYVYYEAGLGDSLMYARYIPLLKDKCKKVLFKPQSNLVTLFEDSNLNAEIIDFNTPVDKMIFDIHIPIMSIPYSLKLNSEEEIPFAEGFLRANPEKIEKYKEKYFNNNKFKIGIKWQGNPAYDTNRIIPIESFYRLFDLPNTKFYSLQKDDGADELEKLPNNYEIIELGKTFNDFADTAAAVENLDLVICNDTSVAHLVGAMGKPCWVMLPFVSNWRWHTDVSYSPWYNSVKLFKQIEPNNWDEAFERVYAELKNICP